jgi:hypothetical protein
LYLFDLIDWHFFVLYFREYIGLWFFIKLLWINFVKLITFGCKKVLVISVRFRSKFLIDLIFILFVRFKISFDRLLFQ